MNNFITFNMLIFMAVVFILMAFAVFTIGFLIGYKREEKKVLLRKHKIENKEIKESDKEKRAKKEWKNFLEYDGSVPDNSEY